MAKKKEKMTLLGTSLNLNGSVSEEERPSFDFCVKLPDNVILYAGEVVCVTGSIPALGNWDIRECVPLQADEDGKLVFI